MKFKITWKTLVWIIVILLCVYFLSATRAERFEDATHPLGPGIPPGSPPLKCPPGKVLSRDGEFCETPLVPVV